MRREERQLYLKGFDKMRRKITDEELLALIEKNENFHGKYADLVRAEKFNEVLKILEFELADMIPVRHISVAPASPKERWGMIYADMPCAFFMSGEKLELMNMCMAKADAVTMAVVDGHIRVSFGFDIWRE